MTFIDKLFLRARNGDVSSMLKFVLETKSIDWPYLHHPKSGDTVAIVAARHGHLNILETAIEYGSNTEQKNLDFKRPLHEAAQHGNIECLFWLLNHGAKIDVTKHADWTALMLACTKNNLSVIQALVAAGADLKLVNKDGWTAFHIACREGHGDIINFFLDVDKDPGYTISKNGRTPLHTAAIHGHIEVCTSLLERTSLNPNVKDGCGSTPLMDSVRGGFVKLSDIFVTRYSGNLRLSDSLGRQCIHAAAESGQLDSLRWLYCQDLDFRATTRDGLSILHLMCKERQISLIQFIIETDPKMQFLTDNQGRTPLHYACISQCLESIRLLLQSGCKDVPDLKGFTALHFFETAKLHYLKDLLPN